MVKYCVANECPIDELACANAAENGHLECLKYLREEAKAPWDSNCHLAAKMVISTYSNILLSVSLINMTKCVSYAAENGHLDCLKYLHETAKAPWDYWAVRDAHKHNQPNVYNTSSTTTVLYHVVGDTKAASYTLHKHIQTNKAFFNRDTYTEMFALLKLFFFLF